MKISISNLISALTIICFGMFSCDSPEDTVNSKIYPERPNIVWIVNEDMSPEHLGAYGGTGGDTPVLDQFAKESLRYTNAFSTAGVCAPSRAAIITGAYQTSIGAMHMRTTGMSASALEYYPPGFKAYSTVLPDGMRGFPEYLRMIGYYTTNNSKEDYQFEAPKTMWDESSKNAHWKNRPDPEQPFFSIFNLTISHESQVWAREDEPLLVDPDSVVVPPVYPDDSISRRTLARFITNVMRMDTQVGELLQELKDAGLYENTIIFYYSDHGDGMPYYKRELYDRGLKIPLMIKAPFLEAGSVTNELVSFVDFGPTVLSLAGIKIPPTMQGQAFLGDQKSAERDYVYAARDRMDSEYDRVRAVSDGRYKYIRNYMINKPNYQNIQYRLNNPLMVHLLELHEEGKLTPDQERWFDETKPKEELYDTQTDPWEFNNLADNPEYQAKLEEMREAHLKWVNYYGDLGSKNEVAMVREWWGGQATPPVTEPAIILYEDGLVALRSPTPSASIGYRKSSSDVWSVYTKPFEINKGDSLYVLAHRIGFEPSIEAVIVE
ncbi:sulfatase family protein [Algoriphagus machipongonensis]|uniref:Sulfatase family protein n=1 Tax=Algoriphagus machipongonensis TaxID=388413 RepID=A3HXL5_9BACT|nr:sulfatase [Algoriphagus machipongonensis]EAZ81338.1 sulfatase family protein [Algoriphagus machipongonensis]